jgi:hypothetical protein
VRSVQYSLFRSRSRIFAPNSSTDSPIQCLNPRPSIRTNHQRSALQTLLEGQKSVKKCKFGYDLDLKGSFFVGVSASGLGLLDNQSCILLYLLPQSASLKA